jgi:hypothetical protein
MHSADITKESLAHAQALIVKLESERDAYAKRYRALEHALFKIEDICDNEEDDPVGLLDEIRDLAWTATRYE